MEPLELKEGTTLPIIMDNITVLKGLNASDPNSNAYSSSGPILQTLNTIYSSALFTPVEIPATDKNEIAELQK